jgi:drug/metabolite transporter (DMT)-like permease
MRTGEMSVVAPFRYTILLFAIVLGFVVFGEVPDTLTLVGAAIVVATGVYTFYRERVRGGSTPATRTATDPPAP